MRKALILAIGNELLIGETLDTNTNWLCRQITGLGGSVARASVLPDSADAIIEELRRAMDLSIDLLITTGGLGPTDDDLTLGAVAKAFDLPLERNEIAYQWLAERYARLAAQGYVPSAEMNPARIKMAMLPAGALPLQNLVGAAPAVELKHRDTTIVCLPGVPEEMRGIFAGSLQTKLVEIFGAGCYEEREMHVGCGDESVLAPILKIIASRHPDVYIKSKAKAFGPDLNFKIKLHSRGDSITVLNSLDAAEKDLREAIAKNGIAILNPPVKELATSMEKPD